MTRPLFKVVLAFVFCCFAVSFVQSNIIDLSHRITNDIPQWPSQTKLDIKPLQHYGSEDSPVVTRGFCMSEHTGTHIDAPFHFSKTGHKLHQLTLEELIAPGVLIDVSDKTVTDHRFALQPSHLEDWERVNGRIPEKSIVIVLTGWYSRWSNAVNYLGAVPTNPDTFRFPGVSKEAAAWLVNNRTVAGVGIDTASVDVGDSKDFPAHKVLARQNVFIIENMKLDKENHPLPTRGFTVYAIPLNLKDGTGSPARVFAIVDPAPKTSAELKEREMTSADQAGSGSPSLGARPGANLIVMLAAFAMSTLMVAVLHW